MTLLEPFLHPNGKNDDFLFEGSYVVYNKNYANYMQLGYFSPQTSAIIQSKTPIKRKNFKLDVYFALDNVQKGGNGFGFWVSSPLKLGGFYGRNKDFKGFGVVISTKKAPYVEYICSNQKRSQRIYLKDTKGSHQISFVHQYPNLKVLYKPARKSKYEVLIETKTNVDGNSVFGISGHTGNAETVLKVYSVLGTSMKPLKDTYVAGSSQKSSPLVLVIGILSILGLVYYLMSKQKKSEKQLK